MKITKLLSLIFLFVISVALVACGSKDTNNGAKTSNTANKTEGTTNSVTTTKKVIDEPTYVLPDLTGCTTEEVKEYFENSDITNYQISVKQGLVYGDGEGEYEFEKFYGFAGSSNVAGAEYKYSKKLTVYVTAYELPETIDEFIQNNPSLSQAFSQVTLDGKTYENKSFIETGCGEVEVVGYVDGDTTRFKDKNGTTVSLRYLGVDTPESTAAFEPWGKAASAYTQDSLSHAKKVVLEAEAAGQTDDNGRYLGWVWYQAQDDSWHLLNLELIMFGYTKDKADSDSIYSDLATTIGSIVGRTGRRVWGEKDPNYDYSTDPKEISIQELKTNFAKYYSKNVKITGIIALVDGCSAVIVDPETHYGVYYYIPSWNANIAYNIKQGYEVTITGTATYYGASDDEEDLDSMDEELGKGSPQLTNFKEKYVTVISKDKANAITPTEMSVAEIELKNLGMYVEFTNLTIKKVYEANTKSGYTVTCTDINGKEIAIRVDNSHYEYATDGIGKSEFVVGEKIESVKGYLTYYYGYQLSLIGKSYITFK